MAWRRHFTPTGPPLFESRTAGVVTGLTLRTARGELLKGLLEGVTYHFWVAYYNDNVIRTPEHPRP